METTLQKESSQTGRRQPGGMLGFTIVWIGQIISMLGTAMTSFALTIWAWQVTGQATILAGLIFAYVLPNVLLSPLAGVLVDRWNRKAVMILSDTGAAVSTCSILLLYATGHLQVWHMFVATVVTGAFQTFQFPAYYAAITLMVPKEHYARANGMISMGQSGTEVLAPITAGLLLGVIGIAGVMTIDMATFAVAIIALIWVHVPQPVTTQTGQEAQGSFWKEAAFGFRYIFARTSLLGLQVIFFISNLFIVLVTGLLSPRVLAATSNNQVALGSVLSASGLGGVIGGLLLSVWGGPKRKIHGVLIGLVLSSLFGSLLLGLGRNPIAWAVAAFCATFFGPIIGGSSQAIWQAKVAPDVQGRVFAARQLIAQLSLPISLALAGPLADHVFEPAMRSGGGLVAIFGGLVGAGPGAGMALMFVIAGVAGILVGLGGYVFRAVREVESILPDHDSATAA